VIRALWRPTLFLAWLFAAAADATLSAQEANGAPQSLAETPLVVETREGTHRFMVQLADDPDERRKGLMFRESMPEDHGMLFDFPRAQRRSFWMKNTPLPLDIIFIRANGRIANIERGEPFTLDPVRSKGRARAVLELNAGTVERLGIKPGDQVRHAIFGNWKE